MKKVTSILIILISILIVGAVSAFSSSRAVSSTPYASDDALSSVGGASSAPTSIQAQTPISPTFTVTASKPVNHFNNKMLGVALTNWEFSWGKDFAGAVPGLDVIYKSAHVGLIRYAGGLWANWAGWERTKQKTPYTEWKPTNTNFYIDFQNKVNTNNTYYFQYGTDEIDSLAQLAQKSGADVMIQVNISQNDPYMWADMVHYTNIEHQYNFKYWELGNEIDLECNQGNTTCMDADTYKTRAAAYIAAMKAVDPSIHIVGGASASGDDIVANNWVDTPDLSRYLYAGRDAGVDDLSYHWYSDCNSSDYTNMFAWSWTSSNTAWKNIYSRSWSQIIPNRVQNEIINPSGKSMQQGISELNDDSCDLSRAPQNGNQINAVWYADILGRLAYNGVDFVNWYEGYGNGSNGGFPFVWVDQDNPTNIDQIYLRPSFYTTFLYGNYFGDQMVQVTAPMPESVSVWASTDSNDPGTLKLIVTNISAAPANATINLSGFIAVNGDKYEMTSSDPLNRTAVSNGPDHATRINGFKLLSTNITTAAAQIPKSTVNIQNGVVKETFAPYSVTALVLRSNGSEATPTPTPKRFCYLPVVSLP
jgi:hypothetical protein